MQPPSTATKDSWPPDYTAVWQWRQQQLLNIRSNPDLLAGAIEYYRNEPVQFINHWMDTYDPRNAGGGNPARMPLILFQRQEDLIHFLLAMIRGEEDGLIEKCRDMGATWVCAAFSVWLWRFWDGASVGWGSRKEQLVDRIGDADSIFEKIRILIRKLPPEFLPPGFVERDHMTFMRILNPDSGATITGEAGDNIGRGGRKLIYFKDESAHYERPEKIEAALGDNTRVQIDISSVNGLGNVFHRRREAGVEWTDGPAHVGKTNVFVMDWQDHPAKTQEWYDRRKAKAEDGGLLHIFAQEVDRDYAASVEGILIKREWVKAAIGAAEELGIEPTGPWIGGFDPFDEGLDSHAFAARRGFEIANVKAWARGDTGEATRKVVEMAPKGCAIRYESPGVGAGVKAEANRLTAANLLPGGLSFVSWNPADAVVDPDQHMLKLPDGRPDKESPKNKDFFGNLKAQAWWSLARRFERTFKAVTEGHVYPPDELVSIRPDIPGIRQLEKELCQVTAKKSAASMKLIIDKAPEGSKSPNMADAVVISFSPIVVSGYNLGAAL